MSVKTATPARPSWISTEMAFPIFWAALKMAGFIF
jgi:hypothetical protein